MNKRIKNFLAILLAVCTILTQGSIVTFATEVDMLGVDIAWVSIYIPNSGPTIGEQVQCEISIQPEGAQYTSATWWSSDTSIVTVDQTGLVKTVSVGDASIHLRVESESGTFETDTKISVQPILGMSVVLNQTEAELNVGDTIQLSGTVSPENTTDKTITWSSTKEQVATVDANGLVTAVGPGETYIIAECGWGKADCHIIVYAPEAEEKTGVDLYKNDVLAGNYDTLNEAFDLMTDKTADYTVVLNENQVLNGYAQWPKVNSIKFMPQLSYYEYGYATNICITEKNTTFNSDVCFDDWVGISPPGSDKESFIYNINIQDYEVTFDCELVGHYITVGDTWFVSGLNFKGGENSKMVFTTGTQFWNSSIQVDTVEFLTTKRNGENTWGFMTLYQCPKENIINNLVITDPNENNCHMNKIDVRGYSDLNALLEIKNIKFNAQYHTKSLDISAEGYADIVIHNADPDIAMDFRYSSSVDGALAQRTSSFSYLGNDIKSIFVGTTRAPHGTLGAEIVYNPVESDKVLLYAPNVASEKVEFLISTQQEFGYTITGGYSYSGGLPCDNGYYYSNNVPTIMTDRIAYVAEGACADTVSYELKNRKDDLKSVKWEAESFDYPYDETALMITDYDKTHVDFALSETDKDHRLIGTFDYGYGQGRVDIPMFMSAPASNVSLSKDEILVEYDGDNSVLYIDLELSYTAEETPKIIVAASDRTVINQPAVFGNTIQVSVRGAGTCVLTVYVGDEILKCNITVVDKNSLQIPTISSVTNLTDGVKVTWNAVESAQKYRIYRRKATENNWKEVGNTTGTSYTDTTVESGVSYSYAVRGVKGDEDPNISRLDETGKKIYYIEAPKITAKSKALGVQIDWNFVDGATGYIVYRREENGSFKKIAGFTDGLTKSYTDKTAVNGITYYYAVKAINSTGQSAYESKGITYKATLETPQFTVSNVAGGVQVEFDFVDGATGYIIYRREAGGTFKKIAGFTDGKTKSYTDTNVVNGTAYFYAVKAINSTTQSTYTTKGINYKATLATPTFTVANVSNGVQIKWAFVDGATGYIIYRREAGGTFSKIAGFTDGKTKNYTDKNVVDGKAYFYAVKAINSTGTIQSAYTTKGINYKAALATPTFTVANVSNGVQIKWEFVDDAIGYIIYKREAGGTFSKLAGFTDGTKSYIDTNVVDGKAYFYAVKAVNNTTQSTYNMQGINYKSSLATPSFTVAKVADGVQVDWNFVDGATGYIIYRREANGTFSKIAGFTDGKTKSYVDTTAVSGTTYYYAVKAINSSTQSKYNSVQITL